MQTILKVISLTLMASFLIACNSTAQTNQKENKDNYLLLSPKEFNEKLELEKSPQLIDVRTTAEFEAGSISGAKNLNLLDGTFEKNMKTLEKSKTVFVFCAKGGRSGKASNLLKQAGFTSVIDLKGGYGAWSSSNK